MGATLFSCIQGFRYELFCMAKTLRTPHCCVWVESDDIVSERWNEERKSLDPSSGYDASMYDHLLNL